MQISRAELLKASNNARVLQVSQDHSERASRCVMADDKSATLAAKADKMYVAHEQQ